MKKVLICILFVLSPILAWTQEYHYEYLGENCIFVRQKNELVLQLDASCDLKMFLKTLEKYGVVSTIATEPHTLVRVSCNETSYYELIDICKKIPLAVLMYSPVLTEIPSNADVINTGDIVAIRDSALSEKEMYALLAKYGCSVKWKSPNRSGKYLISTNTNDGAKAFEAANKLNETGKFEYVLPDFYINIETDYSSTNDSTNDSIINYSDLQWGLNNWGQTGGIPGVDIKAQDAWEITKGSSDIIVAVLDHGVDLTHPDLQPALIEGYNAATHIHSGGLTEYDSSNHGTKCAGIIGAQHNAMYIDGVAPDCKIMPIVIYGDTRNATLTISDAIEYAAKNGASIISMSWKAPDTSVHAKNILKNAINYATKYGRDGKGCVVIGVSGSTNSNEIAFPASMENVIAMGGIDRCGQRSGSFIDSTEYLCDLWSYYGRSNYGPNLDLVAPATNIYSLTNMADGAVTSCQGVSTAAPYAAGVAALMLSVNRNLTWKQVKEIMCSTAQKTGDYIYDYDVDHPYGIWNEKVGYGLINAGASVGKALELLGGDLYVKDNATDDGTEPNITATTYVSAPEITTHYNGTQVDTLPAGTACEVRIVVHNCDNIASTAGKTLKLYFANRQNNANWPSAWLPIALQPGENLTITQSGLIGTYTLPSIAAGGSHTATFNWTAPDIIVTGNFTPDTYHTFNISLLAIVDDGRPTIGLNQTDYDIDQFVVQNNNVARRNLSVKKYVGGTVIIKPSLPPISLAPNPASSQTVINYTLPEGVDEATLTLSSMDGQVLYSTQVYAGSTTANLDVYDLQPGQYLIHLQCNQTQSTPKILIVY